MKIWKIVSPTRGIMRFIISPTMPTNYPIDGSIHSGKPIPSTLTVEQSTQEEYIAYLLEQPQYKDIVKISDIQTNIFELLNYYAQYKSEANKANFNVETFKALATFSMAYVKDGFQELMENDELAHITSANKMLIVQLVAQLSREFDVSWVMVWNEIHQVFTVMKSITTTTNPPIHQLLLDLETDFNDELQSLGTITN